MSAAAIAIKSRPERQAATALLESASLPASDLTDAHLEHFFFCGLDKAPEALVGVEIYGSEALLRSLVVSENARSMGIGSALVAHAEIHAWRCGARAVYLLTTTAQHFFERLGYRCIERSEAPASIQSTPEFSSLCPASSAFMIKLL